MENNELKITYRYDRFNPSILSFSNNNFDYNCIIEMYRVGDEVQLKFLKGFLQETEGLVVLSSNVTIFCLSKIGIRFELSTKELRYIYYIAKKDEKIDVSKEFKDGSFEIIINLDDVN